MRRRHFYTLIVFILILVAPYWLYLPALAVGIVMLPMYWEAVALGFIIDVLYGEVGHKGLSFMFPFAFIITLTLLVLTYTKRYLRYNA